VEQLRDVATDLLEPTISLRVRLAVVAVLPGHPRVLQIADVHGEAQRVHAVVIGHSSAVVVFVDVHRATDFDRAHLAIWSLREEPLFCLPQPPHQLDMDAIE
jgi:hypothetical protein